MSKNISKKITAPLHVGRFNESEFRGAIERAKQAGLIAAPGSASKKGAVVLNGAVAHCEGVSAQFVNVTPAIAREWLGRNTCNRKLRRDSVASFAQDMRRGEWAVTHQGVAFDEAGTLLDGQHRLSAVVESNTPVTMLVVLGLKSRSGKRAKTMDVIDTGIARSLADMLHLSHGLSDSAKIAGTVRTLANIVTGGGVRGKMTMPKTLAVLDLYKEPVRAVIEHHNRQHGLKHTVVLATGALIIAADAERGAAFFKQLASGENLHGKSALLHLRNWILGGGILKNGGMMKGQMYAAQAMAAAWAAWVAQRETAAFLHDKQSLEAVLAAQPKAVAEVRGIFA